MRFVDEASLRRMFEAQETRMRRLIESYAAQAKAKANPNRRVNGVVHASNATTREVLVLIDGDDEVTSMKNATQDELLAGDRVRVQFGEPRGAEVVGKVLLTAPEVTPPAFSLIGSVPVDYCTASTTASATPAGYPGIATVDVIKTLDDSGLLVLGSCSAKTDNVLGHLLITVNADGTALDAGRDYQFGQANARDDIAFRASSDPGTLSADTYTIQLMWSRPSALFGTLSTAVEDSAFFDVWEYLPPA